MMRLAIAAIWGVIVIILFSLGIDYANPAFWCILSLLWALETAAKQEQMDELKASYKTLLAEEEELERKKNGEKNV